MNQAEAIAKLKEILGRDSVEAGACSGNSDTCLVYECMVCGIRDCPHNESLHYHHDGCPACHTFNVYFTEDS